MNKKGTGAVLACLAVLVHYANTAITITPALPGSLPSDARMDYGTIYNPVYISEKLSVGAENYLYSASPLSLGGMVSNNCGLCAIYVFGLKGTLRLKDKLDHDSAFNHIIKDPLKLFVAKIKSTTDHRIYTLQETPGSSAMARTFELYTTLDVNQRMGNIPGTSYMMVLGVKYYYKLDLATKTGTSVFDYSTRCPYEYNFAQEGGYLPSYDAVVIGIAYWDTIILRRDNFAPIKMMEHPSVVYNRFTLDNINSNKFYYTSTQDIIPAPKNSTQPSWVSPPDYMLAKNELFQSDIRVVESHRINIGKVPAAMVNGPISASFVNNILNFGPYQYIVTIVGTIINDRFRIYSKVDLTEPQLNLGTSNLLTNYAEATDIVTSVSFNGMVEQDDKYWFALHAAYKQTAPTTQTPGDGRNFQSYYLSVDKNCTTTGNWNPCTSCFPGFFRLPSTSGCTHPDYFPVGIGADLTGIDVKPCATANCRNCSANYQTCTECDQANGYILVNNTCEDRSVAISFVGSPIPLGPGSQTSIALGMQQDFTLSLTPAQEERAAYLLQSLFNSKSMAFSCYLTSSELPEPTPTVISTQTVGNTMVINLKFLAPTVYQKVTLKVSCSPRRMRVKTVVYRVSGCKGEANYIRPESEAAVKSAEATGKLLGTFTTWAGGHTLQGAAILTTLIALDPTGTFFRFTKILQIVNKLYFININYGKRLEAFLWAIHSTPPNQDPKNSESTMSNGYKGKLTLKREPLSMSDSVRVQIWIYLTSWMCQLLRWCAKRFLQAPSGLLSVMYYFDFVHLIIFNLVFIDFIWLAPRTLMHTKGQPFSRFEFSTLAIALLVVDIGRLLAKCVNAHAWRCYLFRTTRFESQVPLQVFLHKERTKLKQLPDDPPEPDQSDSTILIKSVNPKKSSDRPSKRERLAELDKHAEAEYFRQDKTFYFRVPVPPQTKQINYKKTYFEIELNQPLMRELILLLHEDGPVFASLAVRILAFSPWIRVSVYELVITTCQSVPQFSILVLITFELSFIIALIYAYLKYKYLKNIICLLMEVSQSIFLLLFNFNALFISPKRFDEIIMDFYQDAGIWIVIASCVAEYLLLLTYIGVAAYDFFKNRKMMKKMNVRPMNDEIVKYDIEGEAVSLEDYLQDCIDNPLAFQVPQHQEFGKMNYPPHEDDDQSVSQLQSAEPVPDRDGELFSKILQSQMPPSQSQGLEQLPGVANQFKEVQVRDKPLFNEEDDSQPSFGFDRDPSTFSSNQEAENLQ